MNQTIIAGHLGADPEVRFTSSGQKVTTLRVAARVRRGGKDETIWWRVTIWGEQFDKILSFFKKGSSIIVFGELSKPEIFTDREGKPQVSMNVTAQHIAFSPFGKPDQSSSQETTQPHAAPAAQEMAYASESQQSPIYGNSKAPEMAFSDDEIPF